ncbi:putative integral membrane protein (TIGR00698 family) [Paramicrobacterium agarici]|uniref:Putative integral membrane protein (TIGR00698 family) n=2 Tax=Paramicrobacterium agarici TaxID=630514 RepID=A0A2A9DYF2_9MICO|nr:putative integral membrane protein (TIGR00698 family) [Microbacterium agarici]
MNAVTVKESVRMLPGIAACGAAALVSWGIALGVPEIPLLTACVALGILFAQLPGTQSLIRGVFAPGLAFSSKKLMRAGVVLLGLKLSLVDVAGLGWTTLLTTIAIVLITFAATYGLGKLFRLPGHEPLLMATGFSICGASAIGAMSGVVGAKRREQAHPVALVTLCGTLAIFVLPALWGPLGLTNEQFGHWVGAGVHDVGQVVATAQIAGSSALAIAIVVKLTRVLMLAPIVAVAGAVERRRSAGAADAKRPPIVPLFVAGFIVAILVRSFVPLPESVLSGADVLQTALLAMALFGLGTAVDLKRLLTAGWRSLAVGLISWVLIAALALGAVHLA